MSASAAKVSRKEQNSNHDGADETSGKDRHGGLLRLTTAIFTTLSSSLRVCLAPFNPQTDIRSLVFINYLIIFFKSSDFKGLASNANFSRRW